MNEAIILSMVKPYVKDGSITYDEFEGVFSILSLREKYDVVEILYKNGINLLDKYVDEEEIVLDIDTSKDEDGEFELLYDTSIFKDNDEKDHDSEKLIVYNSVKQSNEILCSMIQQGNRQAMQDLCVKNKGLIDKYASAYQKRYGNRLDFEDLEQAGFMGLIKAAQKFSIQQGTAFSTYAVFWIKQSISREIMDHGYVIRIPVHMMERINKVVAAEGRLLGMNIPFQERIIRIAEELELSENGVLECLFLKRNYLSYSSIDMPVGEDEETNLVEIIPDDTVDSVETVIMNKGLREELLVMIKKLKPKEQDVIKLRFGLDDGRIRTLEEIGDRFGVTRERIRQIESKALQKLSNPKNKKKIREFWEESEDA